ncbi:hypothetical protein GCM10023149_06960 [Mucilaginibacter gynuensis]|uniref:PKD family protein n=1 Tax=Mucilaginibacter gynuensis TaxID=1302236 RepID=A0ABP8FW94_9SPHI
MKCKSILIYILFIISFSSCKKDLGNYNYSPPTEPVVVNFKDNTFDALVGDTLVLQPYVELKGADPIKDLTYDWEIIVEEEARADHYTGYPLILVYNLAPRVRTAKLTITDKRNNIKYFYPFKISGNTRFSKGFTVLSVDGGITKLSFIKPDSVTVISNLYFALHGENLPSKPLQLFARPYPYQPGTAEDYWVISGDKDQQSVIINGSTMLRKRYFKDHFFAPPATIAPEYFEAAKGTATGIINGKLYISITQTAPFAEDWGKFSNPQSGDYVLSPYYSNTNNFYFGFDKKTHAFVSFSNTGNYLGSEYTVNGNKFDPKNLGAGELLFMNAVPGTTYAFYKTEDGTVNELSFSIDMNEYFTKRVISPSYKRVFKGASLINADTKWQRSDVDLFYFTSNDKIYRFNPINEDLRVLPVDFGGKKVSMLKLNGDGTELTAGIEGALILIDVSVGSNFKTIKTINGIPGTPVDVVSKN